MRLGGNPRYPISIHALRVEGDQKPQVTLSAQSRFLSTPSGWRATIWCDPVLQLDVHISIHALRVEGDLIRVLYDRLSADFYPRPPGGGRRTNKVG